MFRSAVSLFVCLLVLHSHAADRPNILWLTSEDNGPNYGCYGDTYATTPNIDALAAKGVRFKRCWSNAPVCAPARTCLISGRWAPSDAAENMRSSVPLPQGHQMYPQLLRAAGYYCTNNDKEDYNLIKPKEGKKDLAWDLSGKAAHWKNRPAGQPFFAVFNNQITHESQIRRRPHLLIHDPAKAPVPPFHPDTPEVRHDWAQYYDNITLMDTKLGESLAELEKAGLAGDTIIIHNGDHGAGMPRFKRWPYNTGLQVGLIIYFPEKWKHLAPKGYSPGGVNEDLISFIDVTATLLSIAGVKPPDYFHGRAFGGQFPSQDAGPPEYIHGFRGRMDERYDLVRSTTDGRYVYIRNYMPQLPYGQYLNYMFQQATTQVWKDLFDQGKLNELQSRFWKTKPAEELYDLESDPWETVNLAGQTSHAETKGRLATAQHQWLTQVNDLGFIPEGERERQSKGASPADVFAPEKPGSKDKAMTVSNIISAADLATNGTEVTPDRLASLLGDPKPAIRYWAIIGHLTRGEKMIQANITKLEQMLQDESPSVRVATAETLISVTDEVSKLERYTKKLLELGDVNKQPYAVALEAVNVLDRWQGKLKPWQSQILALPGEAPVSVEKRLKEYIARLHSHLKAE